VSRNLGDSDYGPFMVIYNQFIIFVECQEEHPACKNLSEVLVWLSVGSEVYMICIWSRWCHCLPIISCFIKIQICVTFLVPIYLGCPGKRPLNGCLSFCNGMWCSSVLIC